MSASFPTSVKGFSTKTDGSGQTVFSAHINDLQDETVAIETELINGPLKPAIGSVAAPAYALAGDLDTGMYSSGANALDFASNGIKALGIDATNFIDSPTQPRCLAFNNTTQSLANATDTPLTFNTESYDVGALHDTGSNPSRFTIPAGADGLYYIQATYVPAAASGDARAFLRKNGTTELEGTGLRGVLSASFQSPFRCSTVVVLAAADYVELVAYQSSGGALNAGDAGSARFMNTMLIMKVW